MDYAFQTATEGESVDGSVAVTSIRNVMCQVVAGINYKFTMDLEWTAKGYDNERLVQVDNISIILVLTFLFLSYLWNSFETI